MTDQQAPRPTMDELAARCEARGWSYRISCSPLKEVRINGQTRVLDYECTAEVNGNNDLTIQADDQSSGHEALAMAVAAMERAVRA